MDIDSRQWQNFIIDGAQNLGIDIDEPVSAAFALHATELIHWNRKINLTTITRTREIAVKHFLDSLAPAGFILDGARLLDIGSGGGFPGIPLKVLKPSLSVLLIDGVRKKVNFLKHVIRTLRLDQSQALHIRAEDLAKNPEFAHSFDVVISRALSDLAVFVKMALPLLAPLGTIIAMRGEVDPKELTALRADLRHDGLSIEVENYRLPSLTSQRALVIIKYHSS